MAAWVRMDPTELAINFRQAADPREQINVLADLNACSPRRIAEQLLLIGALENTGILPEQFPSAYRYNTFIDSLRRLLSPALLNSPFAINGKIVNEIDGFNIDVRNNRIFIDLRTEADVPCAGS